MNILALNCGSFSVKFQLIATDFDLIANNQDQLHLAAMGGADALVFTGVIGENSAEVRASICDGLGQPRQLTSGGPT